jgi:alpha-glucosidase
MHWDATPGAGFTTGEPWLPIDPEHERVNAAAQRGEQASMLSLYRHLIQFRRGSPALRDGAYASLTSAPEGVFAYLRSSADEQLLIALNMTSDPVRFAVTPQGAGGQLELSTDPGRHIGQVPLAALDLGPDEGVIVRLR